MLRVFKSSCEQSLAALANTSGSIDKYSGHIEAKQKAFYWQATANFGRSYYAMCIQWANDTLKSLEAIK